MEQGDVLIVGAGVVGLACAAELARAGRAVLVVERHEAPGREISSRNSEVVHAGLYYPEGSLKASLCVEGRELLYARCAALGLPCRRIGKFVVANDDAGVSALDDIVARGRSNGAGDLEIVDAEALARAEPRVRARAALWSPESGIVDAQALLTSYLAELEAHGGTLVSHTRVIGLEPRASGGWRVDTQATDGERFGIDVARVVNAAGLEADAVAALAGIDIDAMILLCSLEEF